MKLKQKIGAHVMAQRIIFRMEAYHAVLPSLCFLAGNHHITGGGAAAIKILPQEVTQ